MKLIYRWHPPERGVQKALNCRRYRREMLRGVWEDHGSRVQSQKPRKRRDYR